MLYFTYQRIKIIQLSLVLTAGVAGFVSGLLFGRIGKRFQGNCVFYANVSLRMTTIPGSKQPEVLVNSGTTWGKAEVCDLVTFEGVLVAITSFIWLWFFLNMDDTSMDSSEQYPGLRLKKMPRRWSFYVYRLRYGLYRRESELREPRNALFILPPVVLNTILCFLSIVRVTYATDGYQHFCFTLCNVANDVFCKDATDACRQLQHRNWVFLSTKHTTAKVFAFHDAMKAALVMSWVEPLMLATHVLVIMAQVYLEANPPERPPKSPANTNTTSRVSGVMSPIFQSQVSNASHSVDDHFKVDDDSALLRPTEEQNNTDKKSVLSYQSAEPVKRKVKAPDTISLPPFNMFDGTAKESSSSQPSKGDNWIRALRSSLLSKSDGPQCDVISVKTSSKSPTRSKMVSLPESGLVARKRDSSVHPKQ